MSALDELIGRSTELDDARGELEDVVGLVGRAIEHARAGGASRRTLARLEAVLAATARANAALEDDATPCVRLRKGQK